MKTLDPVGVQLVAQALQYGRTHDPLGHQIHTLLAMMHLFLLPLGNAPKDWALIALMMWWCVRLPHIWRSYLLTWRVPLFWAMLAWAGAVALSLLWSVDVEQGFDELGAYRMLILPLLLWPILDRIPWLIGAALAGVLVQNGAQLAQAAGWLNVRPQEGQGRYGGLIHPIKTGAWCVAAMCWHLSAALNGGAKLRWLSVVLFLIAAAGLIATESRGPWLAAVLALPLMLVVTAVRRPALRRMSLTLAIVGALAAAMAWPIIGHRITQRIHDAQTEALRARDQGIYWSSVGLRVGMTKWAWSMFLEHPWRGAGAGSYPALQQMNQDFQAGLERARNDRERKYMTKDHPHSLYLYTLACTGILGGLTLLFVVVQALRRGWVDPPAHLFADGTLFALLAWLIGAQFDCYNLNGHLMGLLALVMAVTLPYRPAIRYGLRARDVDELSVEAAREARKITHS